MRTFKVTFTNGYEICECEDIFKLAEFLKRRYKASPASCRMPIKIKEIES
ncbi:hypothetical protein [Bradyrhizobium sp. SZCCHNR3118]|nr:hypothetical protein [Bradyrhizobium sp. SZCCHNR3118]